MSGVPYGVEPVTPMIQYMAVEVSWGSRWENINDHTRFRIAAEGTRDNVNQTWKKVTADSPILGGNYLIHATPEMVAETVGVWVYGETQTDLTENYQLLMRLMTQWDFRIRWTIDDIRETWKCQLPDATTSRNQVWTHSLMAKAQFSIPRYPDVITETVGG